MLQKQEILHLSTLRLAGRWYINNLFGYEDIVLSHESVYSKFCKLFKIQSRVRFVNFASSSPYVTSEKTQTLSELCLLETREHGMRFGPCLFHELAEIASSPVQ
ncbi:unnamed protein product [Clavelina lepadiformis]|uniref:Uncharacterized protein n=1 Tax=Clavelina lepadiformis TaxID=159417 RepID=A0ABP0GAW1_CLALP